MRRWVRGLGRGPGWCRSRRRCRCPGTRALAACGSGFCAPGRGRRDQAGVMGSCSSVTHGVRDKSAAPPLRPGTFPQLTGWNLQRHPARPAEEAPPPRRRSDQAPPMTAPLQGRLRDREGRRPPRVDSTVRSRRPSPARKRPFGSTARLPPQHRAGRVEEDRRLR